MWSKFGIVFGSCFPTVLFQLNTTPTRQSFLDDKKKERKRNTQSFPTFAFAIIVYVERVIKYKLVVGELRFTGIKSVHPSPCWSIGLAKMSNFKVQVSRINSSTFSVPEFCFIRGLFSSKAWGEYTFSLHVRRDLWNRVVGVEYSKKNLIKTGEF